MSNITHFLTTCQKPCATHKLVIGLSMIVLSLFIFFIFCNSSPQSRPSTICRPVPAIPRGLSRSFHGDLRGKQRAQRVIFFCFPLTPLLAEQGVGKQKDPSQADYSSNSFTIRAHSSHSWPTVNPLFFSSFYYLSVFAPMILCPGFLFLNAGYI